MASAPLSRPTMRFGFGLDCLAAFVAAFALLPAAAEGERLPIRGYTTVDGLAHNTVNKIVRDSRGFLWFATNDGLSRFDGYTFSNYGAEHGLPDARVTDLIETKSGEFWVATFGGLVLFRPAGVGRPEVVFANGRSGTMPMFTTIVPSDPEPRARVITVIVESHDGTIWCGTRKGLVRLERQSDRLELRPVSLEMPGDYPDQQYINDLLEDEHGSLWAAAPSGLYRRWVDGTTAHYDVPALFGRQRRQDLNRDNRHLHDLMRDRRGRIWIGSRSWGFFRISAGPGRRAPVVEEHYGYPDEFASWVNQLLETSDGRFWATTYLGLLELLPRAGPDGSRLVAYNRSHGLTHHEVTALAEDAGGNLWIGSWSGAMKLTRDGFVTFERQDGIAGGIAIFEDPNGPLYVLAHHFRAGLPAGFPRVTAADEHVVLQFGRFDGRGFDWFMPGKPFWWGWVPEGSVLRAKNGEWWLAGSSGLFRYAPQPAFSALETAAPLRVLTPRDGLPENQVYRMFEDSHQDVWFSIYAPANALFRWNRKTDSLTDFSSADGLPHVKEELPRALGEDAAGNVWIGFSTGVARFRDGRFTFYSTADGLPSGTVVRIHTDARGRLWIASSRGGLIRVDNPSAARPSFTAYTTAQGLSGTSIEVMTEDRQGRLYVGTGRGVDRLEPDTGRVKHFTTEDGLAPGWMIAAYRDSSGALWFGTHTGLSRFMPRDPETSPPPSILITGLTVGGEAVAVSATGETERTLPNLTYDASQLHIDFASLRFTTGEHLRYQYRLEGSDSEWGSLGTRRSVDYARLAPGSYRFLVRAMNADGDTSPHPAIVAFTVLPPFWRRGWFLSLVVIAVAAVALALHRHRVTRILELERVRTRIATDLHDDVGANLTRIAILSEVARQRPVSERPDLDAPLSSIANIARESVATMSDIVWAINPQRDTLRDMVRRMRDHAEELFEARDIRAVLDMPELAPPVRLGVDVRRDVYLVFKESVNNAARHANCSTVAISLRLVGAELWLEVNDDGIGFDLTSEVEGNGLSSMRRRAERLGGTLDIISGRGAGTTVRLRMPVREVALAGGHPTSKGR